MQITKVRIRSEEYPTNRCYPFNIPTLMRSTELVLRRPIVFFVGENGSGKSTLLEAITRKCGIHIWDKPKRHVVHDNPYETRLADYIAVTWANGKVPGSLFRAETLGQAAELLAVMFRPQSPQGGATLLSAVIYTRGHLIVMALCALFVFQPVQGFDWTTRLSWPKLLAIVTLFVLALATMFAQSFRSFLYFQF